MDFIFRTVIQSKQQPTTLGSEQTSRVSSEQLCLVSRECYRGPGELSLQHVKSSASRPLFRDAIAPHLFDGAPHHPHLLACPRLFRDGPRLSRRRRHATGGFLQYARAGRGSHRPMGRAVLEDRGRSQVSTEHANAGNRAQVGRNTEPGQPGVAFDGLRTISAPGQRPPYVPLP